MTEHRLNPCPSCDRHVQSSSLECPFCGAILRAGPLWRRMLDKLFNRGVGRHHGPDARLEAKPAYGGAPPPEPPPAGPRPGQS